MSYDQQPVPPPPDPVGHYPPPPPDYMGPYPPPPPPDYTGHFPPPPAYSGYPPPMYFAPQVRPTSGYAVASMVLGIVGILGGWCTLAIPCVLAVILGHAGLNETKPGMKEGRGMAIAGLVLGYVCLVPAILVFFFVFLSAIVGSSTSP